MDGLTAYAMAKKYVDKTLQSEIKCINLEFDNGGYIDVVDSTDSIDTSSLVSNSNYRYSVTSVSEGERYKINVTGGVRALAYAFLDSDKKLIRDAFAPNSGNGGSCFDGTFTNNNSNMSYNGIVTVPQGARYLIINDKKNPSEKCYKLSKCALTIDENSDDFTIPTAKAVYEAIQAALGGVSVD